MQILWAGHPDDRMYVYWAPDGNRITPAILICAPFDDLYEFLRDEYGAQSYSIMIRRKKTMIFSGEIHIGVPLVFTARKDIRLEIEKLRRKKKREIIEPV